MSREEFAELTRSIRAQQIVIHAGQFHQWRTFEICREKGCSLCRARLDALNFGNPAYTPMEEK
jgi:hypothetical protein